MGYSGWGCGSMGEGRGGPRLAVGMDLLSRAEALLRGRTASPSMLCCGSIVSPPGLPPVLLRVEGRQGLCALPCMHACCMLPMRARGAAPAL